MKAVDVAIVGAGPVGLLAAIELSLRGVRVRVLERLAAPSTVAKALSVGPLGAEALERRGMAAALLAAERNSLAAIRAFAERHGGDARFRESRFSGHYAGMTLLRRDAQREPERRMRPADQQAVEAMLAARAASLGIEVLRDREIAGFAQDDAGVDVACTTATGEETVRCAYLVGCDGGRSSIRKLAGIGFPGTPPTLTMYTADAAVDRPERLLPMGWHRTGGGVFAYGPFPGRLFMLDFGGPPANRDAPVVRDEIEAVLRRVSGQDVRVDSLARASRWTDNARLADDYRSGRVFLAGDAAHVHSPFGGQGMSLGLVDAANLGWKLAAVVRGELPESLLETYAAERRPVAEAVLENTRAQTAIMRPDPQSGAMRDLVAKLLEFDDVNRLLGEMTSGLATRYDLDSGVERVGRLAGDAPVSGGDDDASLYGLMQDGSGVLLDASRDRRASALAAAATDRVRCVAVAGGPSMLVRPDACVAWSRDDDRADGLDDALRRWFGTSRGARLAGTV